MPKNYHKHLAACCSHNIFFSDIYIYIYISIYIFFLVYFFAGDMHEFFYTRYSHVYGCTNMLSFTYVVIYRGFCRYKGCVYIYIYIYIYIYGHVHICSCIYREISSSTHTLCVPECIRPFFNIHTCRYAIVDICIYIYIYIYTHRGIDIYV